MAKAQKDQKIADGVGSGGVGGGEPFEMIDARTMGGGAFPGVAAGGGVAVAPAPVAPVTNPPATQSPNPLRAAVDDHVDDEVDVVMVEVPLSTGNNGYATRHISKPLRQMDAEVLRDLSATLHADGTVLEDGKPVVDSYDALSWLLEKIRMARTK